MLIFIWYSGQDSGSLIPLLFVTFVRMTSYHARNDLEFWFNLMNFFHGILSLSFMLHQYMIMIKHANTIDINICLLETNKNETYSLCASSRKNTNAMNAIFLSRKIVISNSMSLQCNEKVRSTRLLAFLKRGTLKAYRFNCSLRENQNGLIFSKLKLRSSALKYTNMYFIRITTYSKCYHRWQSTKKLNHSCISGGDLRILRDFSTFWGILCIIMHFHAIKYSIFTKMGEFLLNITKFSVSAVTKMDHISPFFLLLAPSATKNRSFWPRLAPQNSH